jgi:outer membrane protein insertion porin family
MHTLGDQEYKLKNTVERSNQVDANGNTVSIGDYIDSAGNKVFAFQRCRPDPAKVDQKKFNWLEYYKIKFKADWYTKVYGKLVLRTLTNSVS